MPIGLASVLTVGATTAAGVTDVITSNDEDDVDIIFLVNNFPLFPQLEASQQPPLDPTQT